MGRLSCAVAQAVAPSAVTARAAHDSPMLPVVKSYGISLVSLTAMEFGSSSGFALLYERLNRHAPTDLERVFHVAERREINIATTALK